MKRLTFTIIAVSVGALVMGACSGDPDAGGPGDPCAIECEDISGVGPRITRKWFKICDNERCRGKASQYSSGSVVCRVVVTCP